MTRCPVCQHEFDANSSPKFCPRCGSPSSLFPEDSAEGSSAEREEAGAPSAPQFTSRIGTIDLTAAATPQPAVPLASLDCDGAGPDASADVKEDVNDAKDAKDPAPATPKPRRPSARARRRALREDDPDYYRPVRPLVRAFVICTVLMMSTIIVLALIFSVSLQRLANTAQERLVAINEKVTAALQRSTAEKAELQQSTAGLKESKAELEQSNAELKRSNAELKRSNAELKQTNASLERQSKAAREELLAQDRVKKLPPQLNPDERRAINNALARINGKNRDKNLAGFTKRVTNRADRGQLYEEATRRVLPNLDPRVQEKFKETVLSVIMGE